MVRLTVHCDLFLMGRNPNTTAGAPHSKIASRFDRPRLRIHLRLVSFIVIAPFESVRRWPYGSLPDAGTRSQGRLRDLSTYAIFGGNGAGLAGFAAPDNSRSTLDAGRL